MVEGPADALAWLNGRVRAPLRLTVAGRPGAGRRTVAEAMLAAGALVVGADQDPEVTLYVYVEAPTDEDRDALSAMAGHDRPCLAVLNKADLCGFRGTGPMAAAAQRCRTLTCQTGVPSVPLAALTARAGCRGLDDVVLVGVRTLALDPTRLGTPLRRVLAGELDFYGLAHAIAAVRAGAAADGVAAALRSASGVDGVLAAVERAGAPVRYRRFTAALASRLSFSDALHRDDAVITERAAVAAGVLRASGLGPAGLAPEDGAGTAECLHAAIAWQRYARGPVRELHRACARDLSRAWLRSWAAQRGAAQRGATQRGATR